MTRGAFSATRSRLGLLFYRLSFTFYRPSFTFFPNTRVAASANAFWSVGNQQHWDKWRPERITAKESQR